MDLTTLLAMGSSALTAISKIGQGYQGSMFAKLQQNTADANTSLLQTKATLEADEGQLSLDQGALQQSRTVATINRTLGAETGKFAASGLNPAYGSPLLLEGFSAGQGATDLALVASKAALGESQALLTSAGTEAQAAGSAGQAASFGIQASTDVLNGYFGAATSLLSGGSSGWGNLTAAANGIGAGVSAMGNMIGNMVIPGNWGGSN